jgi:hypothetical protein
MPASRSKKGKKSKATAAAVPASEPTPVPTLEPTPVPALEPTPVPEPEAEDTIVDDNAMQTDQPEPSNSTSPVEITPADSEEAANKLTMEGRKSKLDELRRKMVRSILGP